MSPQISNHKYVSDIVFLDGTKRTIHHNGWASAGVLLLFITGADDTFGINPATVQSVETVAAAQPVGMAQ